LKSNSAKEISLHNDLILDLGEPNVLIMIVNFKFFSQIGSGKLFKNLLNLLNLILILILRKNLLIKQTLVFINSISQMNCDLFIASL
jgi:hypothetical protein